MYYVAIKETLSEILWTDTSSNISISLSKSCKCTASFVLATLIATSESNHVPNQTFPKLPQCQQHIILSKIKKERKIGVVWGNRQRNLLLVNWIKGNIHKNPGRNFPDNSCRFLIL